MEERLDDWLTPLLTGVRSLAALKPDALDGVLPVGMHDAARVTSPM